MKLSIKNSILILNLLYSFNVFSKSLEFNFLDEDPMTIHETMPISTQGEMDDEAYKHKIYQGLENNSFFKKVESVINLLVNNRNSDPNTNDGNVNLLIDITLAKEGITTEPKNKKIGNDIKTCAYEMAREEVNKKYSLEALTLLCSCYPLSKLRNNFFIENKKMNRIILLKKCEDTRISPMFIRPPCEVLVGHKNDKLKKNTVERNKALINGLKEFIEEDVNYCKNVEGFRVVYGKCYSDCSGYAPYSFDTDQCENTCSDPLTNPNNEQKLVTLPIRFKKVISKFSSGSRQFKSYLMEGQNDLYPLTMKKNLEYYIKDLKYELIDEEKYCFKCPPKTKPSKDNKCLDKYGCDIAIEKYVRNKGCLEKCEKGQDRNEYGDCILNDCQDCAQNFRAMNFKMARILRRFELYSKPQTKNTQKNFGFQALSPSSSCEISDYAKKEIIFLKEDFIELVNNALIPSFGDSYLEYLTSNTSINNGLDFEKVEMVRANIQNRCTQKNMQTKNFSLCKQQIDQLNKNMIEFEKNICTNTCKEKKGEFEYLQPSGLFNVGFGGGFNNYRGGYKNPSNCYSTNCKQCAKTIDYFILEQQNLKKGLPQNKLFKGCSEKIYNEAYHLVIINKILEAKTTLKYCQSNSQGGELICSTLNQFITDEDVYREMKNDPLINCLKN